MGAAVAAAPQARAAGKDLEIFLARWEKAKVFTLQVADAMPADAYDFKPKTEMRAYGQLMQHLATNNAFSLPVAVVWFDGWYDASNTLPSGIW